MITLPIDQFEEEGLQFWKAMQVKALKEGGIDPQIMIWIGGRKAASELPAVSRDRNASPGPVICEVLKILPVQAFVMVTEAWRVLESLRQPETDMQFTMDLARARRLQYHPQAVEVLTGQFLHPARWILRVKPMIRSGPSESDKLIGFGVEDIGDSATAPPSQAGELGGYIERYLDLLRKEPAERRAKA